MRGDYQLLIGPQMRQIAWPRIEAAARLRGSNAQRMLELDTTHFHRYPKGHIDGVNFTHLIYDTYVVPETVQVAAHCRGCKAGKQITMQVTPGTVLRPITEYTCAKCAPRLRQNLGLAKKYPYATGSYRAMKQRCTYEGHVAWEHYGGRGITICRRWLGKNGLENFIEDMGERTAELSLDRIDVNGNYAPSNCRWATAAQQVGNRRCSAVSDKDWEEHEEFERQQENELMGVL